MREQPWHFRFLTHEHERWFRNLSELHDLTTSWLTELQLDRPSHFVSRGINPELAENLWMLDSLSETRFETLLDDTAPEDTLARLEHTIWAVQGWTLTGLLERAKDPSEAIALSSLLEQVSWKKGRLSAEGRWSQFPEESRKDLRALFLALSDSPLSCYPRGRAFLIRRAIPSELQVELLACPHEVPYSEVRPVADTLCRLHTQWIRGYAYALNPKIAIESERNTSPSSPRCLQRWTFL